MGRFVLRFDDQTRPIERNGATQTLAFVARLTTTSALLAVALGRGWAYASGNMALVHRFLPFI